MYFGLIAQNVPLVATISAILEAKQCCNLITLLFCWLSWTHCKNMLCTFWIWNYTNPILFDIPHHISMQISWKRGKGKKTLLLRFLHQESLMIIILKPPPRILEFFARHEMIVVKHQHMEFQPNDGLHLNIKFYEIHSNNI